MVRREMPVTALALVPLLMLPVVICAFWLAFSPGDAMGRSFLVFATFAFAWYLCGGAMALRRLGQLVAQRRELRGMTAALAELEAPAFVAGADAIVLAQNGALMEVEGDLVGRRADQALGHALAHPDAVWRLLEARLERRGECRVDLGPSGTYLVSRKPGAALRLWQAERDLRSDPQGEPSEMTTERRSDLTQFDELPVALLLLDERATIVRANALAQDLLTNEIQEKPLGQFLEGPGRSLTDWVADACAGRLIGASEILRLKGEGVERFLQVTLKGGQGDSVTAVLSDVSDLKRLEAQFVQSQKMQAIGQLAGGIAHDFNNLLTAISGHCDLLMLRHDKGDPDFSDLDQISQNANRAAALVGQLLAYSRKQTLKLQVFDLRDSLADLTHLLNRLVGEKILLTFHHDPKLHMIRADKRQFEQVVMNLIVNARDAMPEGGDIVIRTANHLVDGHAGAGEHGLPAGDYVCIEVRDEGCGMPPEVISRIFEPFFSTKRTGEGTGLGLSTAYGIVKQTGGFIFCDSRPGEGTRFSLYFPGHVGALSEPDADAEPPVAAPVARIEKEATVLLVEDEAPVRAFASRALQLQGFRVLEAACAEDALELLSDRRLVVDVFVTDVVMPGMDGPAWVRTALRERPATKVIFMSGYSESIFAEGQVPVPNSVFLAKPFSLSELTALVSKQLQDDKAPAPPAATRAPFD